MNLPILRIERPVMRTEHKTDRLNAVRIVPFEGMILLLAACGGGGGGGGAPASAPVPMTAISVRVYSDRLLGKAEVWIDRDGDGQINVSHDQQLGKTNAQGSYKGETLASKQNWMLIARSEEGVWYAPRDSEVISPLTHYLVVMREAEGLGLKVDVKTYDPFADNVDQATANMVRETAKKVAEAIKEAKKAKEADPNSGTESSRLEKAIKDMDKKPTAMSLNNTSRILKEDSLDKELAIITFDDPDALDELPIFLQNKAIISRDTAGIFEIRGNALRLREGAKLDFEGKALHTITLTANTNSNLTAQFTLTITNANEEGSVKIRGGSPRVDKAVTVTSIVDPDGTPTNPSYQWQKNDGTDWADIAGETDDNYTPVAGDRGHLLRVKVTYTDAFDGTRSTITSKPTSRVVSSEDDEWGSTDDTKFSDTNVTSETYDNPYSGDTFLGASTDPYYQSKTGEYNLEQVSHSPKPTSPLDLGLPKQTVTAPNFTKDQTFHDLIGYDQARTKYEDINGKGYSIVIIDSGLDLNHAIFGSRIIAGVDMTEEKDGSPQDDDSHGSFIASILGGRMSSVFMGGIAPDVNLIALQGLEGLTGSASSIWLEAALQWVIQNATTYNIVAVNFSIGPVNPKKGVPVPNGGGDSQYFMTYGNSRTKLADEFRILARDGVITVASAGNEYDKFSPFGFRGIPHRVAHYAADVNTIAVGAIDKMGAISRFSQRDDHVIFAPGEDITAASKNGEYLTGRSGTSYSTPIITGAVALAQQIAEIDLGRRLTIEEVQALLQYSAYDLNERDRETSKSFKGFKLDSFLDAVTKYVKANAHISHNDHLDKREEVDNEESFQVPVSASISDEGKAADIDWFKITLDPGHYILFMIADGGSLDPHVQIYFENFSLTDTEDLRFVNDDHGLTKSPVPIKAKDASLSFSLSTEETIFIRSAASRLTKDTNKTGDYKLHLYRRSDLSDPSSRTLSLNSFVTMTLASFEIASFSFASEGADSDLSLVYRFIQTASAPNPVSVGATPTDLKRVDTGLYKQLSAYLFDANGDLEAILPIHVVPQNSDNSLGLPTDTNKVYASTAFVAKKAGDYVIKIVDASGGAWNVKIAVHAALPKKSDDEKGQVIEGSYGDDWLEGGYGSDIIKGDDGDDFLFGGPDGRDVLEGGEGNDLLEGGKGADYLGGGPGFDYGYYINSPEGVHVVLTSIDSFDEDVTGFWSNSAKTLKRITITAGDEYIVLKKNGIFEAVDQTELAGLTAGEFALLAHIDSDGTINSQLRYDKKELFTKSGSDYLFSNTDAQARYLERGWLVGAGYGLGGHAEGDLLSNVEALLGSHYDDHLEGNGSNNFFRGYGGADKINGHGGYDGVSYSTSPEAVTIDLNDSTKNAGGYAEGDVLISIERLTGSRYDDTLSGDKKNNWLNGGKGEDKIDGRGGFDVVSYHQSNYQTAVHVKLGEGTAEDGFLHRVGTKTLATKDTLKKIEGIYGSDNRKFIDILEGDSNDNWIHAGGRAKAKDVLGGDGSKGLIIEARNFGKQGNEIEVEIIVPGSRPFPPIAPQGVRVISVTDKKITITAKDGSGMLLGHIMDAIKNDRQASELVHVELVNDLDGDKISIISSQKFNLKNGGGGDNRLFGGGGDDWLIGSDEGDRISGEARDTNGQPTNPSPTNPNPTNGTRDPKTGWLIDSITRWPIHPVTNEIVNPTFFTIDSVTGNPRDPITGWLIEPKTGWFINSENQLVDPKTVKIDPITGFPIEQDPGFSSSSAAAVAQNDEDGSAADDTDYIADDDNNNVPAQNNNQNDSDGSDTVDYRDSSAKVYIFLKLGKDLDNQTDIKILEDALSLTSSNAYRPTSRAEYIIQPAANKGDAEGDWLYSIENVVGSQYGDLIVGSDEDNLLAGRAGDDAMQGEEGEDWLIGGYGNDVMIGGDDDDTFIIDINARENDAGEEFIDKVMDFVSSEDKIGLVLGQQTDTAPATPTTLAHFDLDVNDSTESGFDFDIVDASGNIHMHIKIKGTSSPATASAAAFHNSTNFATHFEVLDFSGYALDGDDGFTVPKYYNAAADIFIV